MTDETREGYKAVAVCPHIPGYFEEGAIGTISADCLECGHVSVDSPPPAMPSRRGFGFKPADVPPGRLSAFIANDE